METKIKVIMLTNLTETEQKVFQLIWYKKYGISRTEIVNKTIGNQLVNCSRNSCLTEFGFVYNLST